MTGAAMKASLMEVPSIGVILAMWPATAEKGGNKMVQSSCILCFVHVVFKRFVAFPCLSSVLAFSYKIALALRDLS